MDAREFEVRCQPCDAGFALGTPRCVHCGEPLVQRSTALHLEEDGAAVSVPGGPLARVWTRLGPGFVALLFVGVSMITRSCAGEP
jgi:hypothetical protein